MVKENRDGKIIVKISIIWLFVLAILVLSTIAFFKNNIFAANGQGKINEENTGEENTVNIEKNEQEVDILSLMIENNYENKKLINEEREIPYQTEVIETDKLPKDEEVVTQVGVNGNKQVTALQTFQDEEFIKEDLVEEVVKENPVTEIINKGTSEYLSKYQVHIGEEMYLIESGDIKKEEKEDSETVYSIRRYLNVVLEDFSEQGDWAKIKYNDYEGYIQKEKLTSDSVTPKIKEKNRIAKLQAKLSIDMDLSKPSGFTRSDYITIFKGNRSDRYNIFEDNAEVFYQIEQEYKINGIFLAAIGIHESGWGTSSIAREKYNLFGYKAYDRNPGKYAQDFETYADCIRVVGKAVATNYLSVTGSYYNEPTLEGVNTKYASDKEWHTKVYKYMEYLYEKLG